jgi:hypothetical protein
MICACVVTSSAVVASSAISSFGSAASAIAIITRWRIPPESRWGYCANRSWAAGSRTSSISSIARSWAAALESRACIRTASVICAPTRIVGFSDRVGSWKTIAIEVPRCARICRSEMPTSSSPSNRIDPLTVADPGSSPITARALTVLPEPDSPITATVRARRTSHERPSTARTRPPPTRKSTRRSRTANNGVSDAAARPPGAVAEGRPLALTGCSIAPEARRRAD